MVVVEVTNNFNLGLGKDHIEELLEVVPEELLKLEQEHISEEGKRKGKCRRRKRTPKKMHSEIFGKSFW